MTTHEPSRDPRRSLRAPRVARVRALALGLALATGVALGGCDDAPPPVPTSPGSAPRLIPTPLRIVAGDQLELEVEEDGTLRRGVDRLGRWTSDGIFVDPHDVELASLTPSGELRSASGASIGAFEDGSLRLGDVTLEVLEDGTITGTPAGAPAMRVVPRDTSRRFVLLTLAMAYDALLVTPPQDPDAPPQDSD
ncbi:MAG: hypothetical protein KF901_22335 [Myxococcales bacterium]|nr:hypothetical protein [Myxococcales bacterium]